MYRRVNIQEITQDLPKSKYMTVKCQNCGVEFSCDSHIVWRKYCSMGCVRIAKNYKSYSKSYA